MASPVQTKMEASACMPRRSGLFICDKKEIVITAETPKGIYGESLRPHPLPVDLTLPSPKG